MKEQKAPQIRAVALVLPLFMKTMPPEGTRTHMIGGGDIIKLRGHVPVAGPGKVKGHTEVWRGLLFHQDKDLKSPESWSLAIKGLEWLGQRSHRFSRKRKRRLDL